MTKHVWIHIVSSSDLEEEGADVLAQGTYYLKNGTHYLLYEGLEEDGIYQTTQHRIKFADGKAEVTKRGRNRTQMVFEQGAAHCCEYDTGCGVLLLTFATDELLLSESGEELRLAMKYRILLDQVQLSENKMEITVTPCIRREDGRKQNDKSEFGREVLKR